jgi:hypothetical protein
MAFLVSVDFQNAPRFEHPDFDSAMIEAVRLSKLPQYKTSNIRVLEEVVVIPRGGPTTRQKKLQLKRPDVTVSLETALQLGWL